MALSSAGPLLFGTKSMVTATLGPHDGDVGLHHRDDDGRLYRLIYNDADTQGVPGMGFVVNAGASGYSCTISSTTSADLVVGIVRHATITTNTYGWVVVEGVTTVKMGATSGTVSTGGLIEVAANGLFVPISNTTGNKSPAVGKALNTIASSGTGDAYVRCY